MAEIVNRTTPPLPRRVGPCRHESSQPKNFGISRITMVKPNKASERSASNRGNAGTSVNSLEKYSGLT